MEIYNHTGKLAVKITGPDFKEISVEQKGAIEALTMGNNHYFRNPCLNNNYFMIPYDGNKRKYPTNNAKSIWLMDYNGNLIKITNACQ